jgi:methionine-S-sulfoxide reductase
MTLRHLLRLAPALLLAACQPAPPEGRTSPPASAEARPSSVGVDPGHAGAGTALAPRPGHALAAFAAGCFWGVEDAFRKVPGVTATAVGYSGGHTAAPTYREVCGHGTGHAETVLVEFDPAVAGYEKLLAVFFRIHDPTTLNRQGPDEGDQYRSAVFTFSREQEALAREAATRAQAKLGKKVVTQIEAARPFYKAEDYHQQYAERTGHHGCALPNVDEGT